MSFKCNMDIEEKANKFRTISGTIQRTFKTKVMEMKRNFSQLKGWKKKHEYQSPR